MRLFCTTFEGILGPFVPFFKSANPTEGDRPPAGRNRPYPFRIALSVYTLDPFRIALSVYTIPPPGQPDGGRTPSGRATENATPCPQTSASLRISPEIAIPV